MQTKNAKNETKFSVHGNFKLIRESLGLSQEEFGLKLGLSISGVSRIESGETLNLTHNLLALLIKNYKVNINWFFFDEGEMFGEETVNIHSKVNEYNNLVAGKTEKYRNFEEVEKDEEIKRLKSQIDILINVIERLK